MRPEERKLACEALQRIESRLLSEAIILYLREDYPRFWEAVEALDKFLDVKGEVCRG